MKKEIVKQIKLQIESGKATPAPPIGPALGAAGLNIMKFCQEFNAKTKDQNDLLPVVISVYKDKSFSFILKKPPLAQMIKKECGIEKGSALPNRNKVATLNREQILKLLKAKREDLRVHSEEAGIRVVVGIAKSIGVEVEGV